MKTTAQMIQEHERAFPPSSFYEHEMRGREQPTLTPQAPLGRNAAMLTPEAVSVDELAQAIKQLAERKRVPPWGIHRAMTALAGPRASHAELCVALSAVAQELADCPAEDDSLALSDLELTDDDVTDELVRLAATHPGYLDTGKLRLSAVDVPAQRQPARQPSGRYLDGYDQVTVALTEADARGRGRPLLDPG